MSKTPRCLAGPVLLLAGAIWASADSAAAQTSPGAATREELPQFVHQAWTVEDGLPVNSINALVQSRDGYIWAATFDGLVRFDGVRFTIYNTENSENLPSNRTVDLIEARDGTLWMLTEQGHLVGLRDGVFMHVDADRGLDAAAMLLHEDTAGTVWVGTEQGLGVIRDDRFVGMGEGTLTGPVTALAAASESGLWVGTWRGRLYRYADGGATEITGPDRRGIGGISALHEGADGTLWIGTTQDLFRYNGDDFETIEQPGWPGPNSAWLFLASPATDFLWAHTGKGVYRIEGDRLTRVAERPLAVSRTRLIQTDENGRVWLASGQTLYLDEQPVYTLEAANALTSTTAIEIRGLLRDHEGSVWLGTNSAGLHRLKPALFRAYSEEEGLAFPNIYSVAEGRSGEMWFGTWGEGFSRLRNGTVTNFRVEQGYPRFVQSVMEDRTGRLWLGSYAHGLWTCTVDPVSCSRTALQSIGSAHVFAVYEDRQGTIWAGTAIGVHRLDGERWNALAGAPEAPVRAFAETDDGALWMGTNGAGVTRYHDGTFTPVTTADGLTSDLIRSLYADADGWLWIGTEGRGLARIAPEEWATPGTGPGRVWSVGTRDGLFDAVIHQILEDDAERLWMSTNRGIFWVRRDELNAFADGAVSMIHSTAYTERDGLRNREANGGAQPAGFKARDGRLWFATQDGAVVVDPAQVNSNMVPPPVVVEGIVVRERVIRPGAARIALAADERDLQIDYTGLSFLAPENVRFRYRLEGYDADWVEAGNRRTAFYTQVPPGGYTFRVIASNNDGVWNETGAAVGLQVAPFFYETKTYYFTLAAALSLLAFAGLRWRVRRLETRERELSLLVDARTGQLREREAQLEAQNAQLARQAMKLEEHDRAKSRFFANVSHELRTPLTLTIGPLEDLRREVGESMGEDAADDLELALRNSRRLLRLVNQILDISKLEAGQLAPHFQQEDLTALVTEVAESFAPLADRERVDFQIAVPDHGVSCALDADMIEKAIANLLSNAFKFTPDGGTVRLELDTPADRDATISVRDSGPGIPADDLDRVFERFYQVSRARRTGVPGTGIGLSLAKEFVELHGGRIDVESEVGFGSVFRVVLSPAALSTRLPAVEEDDAPQGSSQGTGDARSAAVAAEALAATDTAGAGDSAPSIVDADASSNGGPDRTTVLVAEDNAEVRSYVRKHLSESYRVLTAANGREALELARRELPDLVISDLMMPEMDGLELCRAMKSDPALDFIPVILLTARAEIEDKLEGLHGGADDYLTKPFEFAELKARIQNLVTARQRLRDRARREAMLRPADIAVTSPEETLLDRVRRTIEAHLADEEFDVDRLAAALGSSRSHLYRSLDGLVEESPAEIIQSVRLERAAQLLGARAGTVSEVAYGVGFKSVSHFSRRFRQRFGVPPSEFSTPAATPPTS